MKEIDLKAYNKAVENHLKACQSLEKAKQEVKLMQVLVDLTSDVVAKELDNISC